MLNIIRPRVLIYGIGQQAQQIYKLISADKVAKICGFVVDKGYKKCENLLGKRVYEFKEMLEECSPDKYQVVISFGYKNMVKNRQEKFNKCHCHGYKIFTYVSKKAVVYADEIGEGTIIYPNVFLAPFVKIGKGCFLENGVSIAHHSQCNDFVFWAPNAVVCGGTLIGNNCFIGANAVVTNSLNVANRTLVAAGAKLSEDTSEGSICFPGKNCITLKKKPEIYI